jgi:hypothetical protein
MTNVENKPAIAAVKEVSVQNPGGPKELVRAVMQEMLEAEMTDAARVRARWSFNPPQKDLRSSRRWTKGQPTASI